MTKKYNIFWIVWTVVVTLSCQSEDSKINTEIGEVKPTINENRNDSILFDTIYLNKSQEYILTLLKELPDSAFELSWSWPKMEREKFVNQTIKDGFVLNLSKKDKKYDIRRFDKELSLQKKFIDNSHLYIELIEGYVNLKLYLGKNNITVFLVNIGGGDSKQFSIHKFKNGTLLSYVNFENFMIYNFESFIDFTRKDSCKLIIDESFEASTHFEFNSDSINLTYIQAKENSKCFAGNTINYVFDKESQNMKRNKIYWRN